MNEVLMALYKQQQTKNYQNYIGLQQLLYVCVCIYISLDHGLDNESHIIISDLKLVTETKLISKGFTQGVDCGGKRAVIP